MAEPDIVSARQQSKTVSVNATCFLSGGKRRNIKFENESNGTFKNHLLSNKTQTID